MLKSFVTKLNMENRCQRKGFFFSFLTNLTLKLSQLHRMLTFEGQQMANNAPNPL